MSVLTQSTISNMTVPAVSRAVFGGGTRMISVDDLEMKVADSPTERRKAFHLAHDVYARSGLTEHSPSGVRVMRQHLADTTRVMIASCANEVVFTVTLVDDNDYGLPMESLFGDEVALMREQGTRFAEVSCLASHIDADNKRLRFDTLVRMVSLLIQSGRRRGLDCLLLAVHPKHAKAYQRLFGCVAVSGVKSYAAVRGNPAILCVHDFSELDKKKYPLYNQVYGARFAPWQLDGTGMSENEKVYYEQFLPVGEYEVVPVAA